MIEPELFPPKGYYRADEAYRHWMEIRYDHKRLSNKEIDDTRQEFLSWLRTASPKVNVLTKEGNVHDVPSSAWDSKFFPDLILLHKSIPLIKGSPFERYAGAILIVHRGELDHWAVVELRDELLEELRYGRMDLNRARMIAAKAGIESLEGNPDPSGYDPRVEPYWSLPMAVSWIATRDLAQVREHWDKYLEKCFYFSQQRWKVPGGEINEGWVSDNRKLAAIGRVVGDNFSKAKPVFFNALKLGTIIATAIPEQGVKRDFVPKHEWQDLRPHKYGEKEVFRPASGADGYKDVTVERDAVLANWPAPIAVWDFALAKRNNDKDLAGRLVADFYAAFWQGEFDGLELTLAQDKLFAPGAEIFDGLSREYLAQVALGSKKFAELGPERTCYDELARWNIADYAKVDTAYRYYFVPEHGVGSLGSQGRGLCAPPDILGVWLAKREPRTNGETNVPAALSIDDVSISRNGAPSLKPISDSDLRAAFNKYCELPQPDLTRDGIENWGKQTWGGRVATTRLRALYKAIAPLGGNKRGRKTKAA